MTTITKTIEIEYPNGAIIIYESMNKYETVRKWSAYLVGANGYTIELIPNRYSRITRNQAKDAAERHGYLCIIQ